MSREVLEGMLQRWARLLRAAPTFCINAVCVYVRVRRPIYAGNGLATVQVTAQGPRMLTVSSRRVMSNTMLCSLTSSSTSGSSLIKQVRPSAFPTSAVAEVGGAPAQLVPIESDLLSSLPPDSGSKFEGEDLTKTARPELGAAK